MISSYLCKEVANLHRFLGIYFTLVGMRKCIRNIKNLMGFLQYLYPVFGNKIMESLKQVTA